MNSPHNFDEITNVVSLDLSPSVPSPTNFYTRSESVCSKYRPHSCFLGYECLSIRFGSCRCSVCYDINFYVAEEGLLFFVNMPTTSIADNSEVKRRDAARRTLTFLDGEKKNVHIRVSWLHIEEIQYAFSPSLSVFFILIDSSAADRLRRSLNMDSVVKKSNSFRPYFNSVSISDHYKYITVILKRYGEEDLLSFEELFRDNKHLAKQAKHIQLKPLSYDEASKQLLKTIPPPLVQAVLNGAETIPNEDRRPCPKRRKLTEEDGNEMECINASTAGPSTSRKRDSDSDDEIICISPTEKREPKTVFQYPLSSDSYDREIVYDTHLKCLKFGRELNDIVINVYLKYLWLEKLPEDLRKRTYIFSSFFYQRLTRFETRVFPKEPLHQRVTSWTHNVDLFEYDFIVMPINQDKHWLLAVICMEKKGNMCVQPSIIIFDSLKKKRKQNNYKIVYTLSRYLKGEYSRKKLRNSGDENLKARGFYPNVVQQKNMVDCGVYVLEFAERFLMDSRLGEENVEVAEIVAEAEQWTAEGIKKKRGAISELMRGFAEKWNESGGK